MYPAIKDVVKFCSQSEKYKMDLYPDLFYEKGIN